MWQMPCDTEGREEQRKLVFLLITCLQVEREEEEAGLYVLSFFFQMVI
jgi:hypothetical protein